MIQQSVWYVGGKSAGHIIPLITLALESNRPSVLITSSRELDKQIVAQARVDAEHYTLHIPDIQRKKIWLYPWYAATWVYAGIQLARLYLRTRPQKIISTGGIISVPVFLWAKIMRIPCYLFELNAVPGDAVALLAPFSTGVFYCYKTAAAYLPEKKIQYKPYPVRELALVSAYQARSALGLDPEKKTLCFLGGSQGSLFINELARRIVAYNRPDNIQIIHQTGAAGYESVAQWYADNGYKAFVVDFYKDIDLLYAACDGVVCRAGAGTLWELEFIGVPTCIIPLQTAATDHQVHNARALCAQKPEQFMMLLQSDAERRIPELRSFLSLTDIQDEL